MAKTQVQETVMQGQRGHIIEGAYGTSFVPLPERPRQEIDFEAEARADRATAEQIAKEFFRSREAFDSVVSSCADAPKPIAQRIVAVYGLESIYSRQMWRRFQADRRAIVALFRDSK